METPCTGADHQPDAAPERHARPAADGDTRRAPRHALRDAAADCAAMRDDPTADMERMIREALEGSAPTITIRDPPADRPGCDRLRRLIVETCAQYGAVASRNASAQFLHGRPRRATGGR